MVIVDGAAFGAMIENCLEYLATRMEQRISIWMPESFEYLILRSGLFQSKELWKILDSTSDYVESKEYESWERYFTQLLITMTSDKPYQYSKKGLNEYYMQDKNVEKIIDMIPEVIRNKIENGS